MNRVVTRIPPSPTGHLHIGTVRTALFNYLFARHHGGRVVFRSEDTDRARSKREFEEEIIEGLAWLGLVHDEFSRQSENLPRHQKLLSRIIEEDKAYVSKEEKKDSPGEMVEVVRLRNPGRRITFSDLVRGEITFDTAELGDFVIARALDDPLYHFAVVADDMDAGITHVIRGEEHISNTPRQILIQEALGAPRPLYAHLPLILAADRSKMSKRHGATSLLAYREDGFLPEAILNYLVLLGWSPKDDREDFSLGELVTLFDIVHVHKAGAVFDLVKFKSVNQRWMRKLSDEEFIKRGALEASDSSMLKKIVPFLKERAHTFKEARELLSGEFSGFFGIPKHDARILTAKEPREKVTEHLNEILVRITPLEKESVLTPELVKQHIMSYADEKGRGEVLWPLRYALSGQEKSPDPFTFISVKGIPDSTSSIMSAIETLKKPEQE